jgi:energy-coupling factor transporter transmembrane protein EcfT
VIPGPAFADAARRANPLAGWTPEVRLATALLGVATVFTVPPPAAPVAALIPACLLAASGLTPAHQARSLLPWWSVALLVVAVHTLTTTEAAPLGHPSLAGFVGGLVALTRVAGSAGWLAVLMRTTALDDLMTGVRWWLRPLRRLGLRDDDLPLVLVVALGTAPTMLGEARRIEAVIRLRRGAPVAGGRRRWLVRQRDRARVVVPLLESLVRRAEALSLSLRRRRPVAHVSAGPSTAARWLLALWFVVLVLLALPAGWWAVRA